ncbi:hypothetical protein ElyMa_000728100 [Elysia marginata]|uniref:Uncharacterized protein n=1 Tax=Elysia marginata TaxID=1093978 RepID=A0AAV4GNV3_9GAST|nr:hypothetical protein ElyMa_000728100 [Elysia marginata]
MSEVFSSSEKTKTSRSRETVSMAEDCARDEKKGRGIRTLIIRRRSKIIRTIIFGEVKGENAGCGMDGRPEGVSAVWVEDLAG